MIYQKIWSCSFLDKPIFPGTSLCNPIAGRGSRFKGSSSVQAFRAGQAKEAPDLEIT